MTTFAAQKRSTAHSYLDTSIIIVVQISDSENMVHNRKITVAAVLTDSNKIKLNVE